MNWLGGHMRWSSSLLRSLLCIMLSPQLLKLAETSLEALWVALILVLLCILRSNWLWLVLLREDWRKLLMLASAQRATGRKRGGPLLEGKPCNLVLTEKVRWDIHATRAWSLSWIRIKEPGSSARDLLLWHDRTNWGGNAAKAWLAVQAVGTGLVLKLSLKEGRKAALHLHLFHVDLLLCEELPLTSHQVLLFLLAAFKVVLLLCGQGGSKARESTCERRLNSAGSSTGGHGGRKRRTSCCCGWTVRNTDLWDEEWLTRVANTSDKLAKRLKFGVLKLLH
jgi:hypothetical protein